ncbi:phosphotransferase system sugar-specific permease eiia type 1 [Trichococcus palustris]|jgi:glucose PTS system EIICBA or EIICB component|uniref:Phosphotransferase system sugar-specific permease eiia type 1 n=2 Tax=Trichococcus palustris TaxID=140314 RepID=A0A143YU04_9LACT|nr:PTS glucose transporter subunit IIA [Trichococcus palustris]CZQ98138.1 phosphotransferase system sugar-specific permease eiia type 1 [Trichococcus palustris]SFK95452.1 phosphoenolpyruvate-dependent sugar phosphotransferase system, EIIA 1 [Trichococcus palustris]
MILHVGLDTVNLNGQGFEALVKEGDVVTAGQPLLKVDYAYRMKEEKDTVTLVVFTNLVEKAIHLLNTGKIKHNQDVVVDFD